MPTLINRIPSTTLCQVGFWRILGFLSSVVGLLSHLLSSSFCSMIAHWNFWKVLLYIVVISLIVLAINILFIAMSWKLPQNLLLRSHVVFLVWYVTSVYSFFYDIFVKVKPDTLSLISGGSFALMFLSLQRLKIQLGFEDDLLKLFLGILTIQLMNIRFSLSLVGLAFCYFPIVLPSYFDSRSAPISIATVQENVAVRIDTSAYHLSKQLCSILGIENDSENGERFIYPLDFESKLKVGITSGFVKECYEVFITWRKQFLNDKLLSMGFQKLNIEEVHKLPLKYLKDDIEQWAKACHVAVKTLFPHERHLCNVVFSGLSPLDDLSFMEVSHGLTRQLLNYADAVSTTAQSLERLFRMVEVLETLEEILPDMESFFCNQHCGFLYDQSITVCKRLEEATRGVFMELENLIRQDASKLAIFGGGLHPTNHYVMNYLGAACMCQKTLERIFKYNQVSLSSSSLSKQLLRILELLETNLKSHSKIYEDSALRYVFMMNNMRYIVHKAKNSELGNLLGEQWMQNHRKKVIQYFVNYQRSSWDKVLELLNIIDYDHQSLNVLSHAMENIQLFKSKFEETCENQSSWVIFDDQLRNVIMSSLKKIMLCAYENFMTVFLNDVEIEDFGVQVIADLISKLFLGKDKHTDPMNIQTTWTTVMSSGKDFYEWRKYGEKKIPTSTHPRKYYRCIYKNDQGCRARKHVQQIQENPKMYKTCYFGFHTCTLFLKAHAQQ